MPSISFGLIPASSQAPFIASNARRISLRPEFFEYSVSAMPTIHDLSFKVSISHPLILAMSFLGRQSHGNLTIAESVTAGSGVNLQIHQVRAFHIIIRFTHILLNRFPYNFQGIIGVAGASDVKSDLFQFACRTAPVSRQPAQQSLGMHNVYNAFLLTAPFRKGFIMMYRVAVPGCPGTTANLDCIHLHLIETDILSIRYIFPVDFFPLLHFNLLLSNLVLLMPMPCISIQRGFP